MDATRKNGHITSLPFEVSTDVKAGRVLAGDDFLEDELVTWFEQEREAYYEGDQGNSESDPWYGYMRFVNERLGFSKISQSIGEKGSMLVLGPGSGIEVEQFCQGNPEWSLSFLESSTSFRSILRRKWTTAVLVEPQASGNIALPDGSQNIVCAFSVLHHIPNVSKVIREVYRVTSPGGLFLVREPCSSMGDWRYPRSATPNERGISRVLLTAISHDAGFVKFSDPVPILFEPINKILKRTIGFSVIPTKLLYLIDRLISRLLAVSDYYWRDTWYKKLGPSSYFYIFRKPASG